MPANTLGLNQVSTVLNAIINQATGNTGAIANINGGDLITVAQKQLLTNYDNFIGAISQVLSRTIFSVRPYNAKFRGLMADNIRYGNHVRKITPLQGTFEDNGRLPLVDGTSVDQYTINKPKAVQLNFYGQNDYERRATIHRDQMDVAFRNEEEAARYISMQMVEIANEIELSHETTARAALVNFIAGIISGREPSVIHLLTEYNAYTGLSLTSTTVMQPENYGAFMKWVYARIDSVCSLMTEFSTLFHTNLTEGNILRHTPRNLQKVYLYAPNLYQYSAQVLADTYHDTFLRYSDVEYINFWQNINDPTSIAYTPTYLLPSGELTVAAAPVEQSNVFGVIFDEEAVGMTVINYNVDTTPFNARGRYNNTFWHFTDRYWNDFTENGVVLLLD